MSTTASLAGKTAIVTGSTSGIGLGIAHALASEGANILLNGLGDPHEIDALQKDLAGKSPGRIEYSPANMLRPAEITQMITDAASLFGTVDILVNNAGIQHVSPVEEFPVKKWDEIIAINLSSAFHTIRAAVPLMRNQGWGRIVNIASAHSLVASPFKSAYVSAKHGLAGLTKTVALELARSNITVNAIAPGYVKTSLVTGQIAATAKIRGISEEEVVRDMMQAAQPTEKFISIKEVAALVVYLCSDLACSITGTVQSIDGGWSAR